MATATIKKITAFTAPDGTQHASAKAAAEYVQNQAVKDALNATFEPDLIVTTVGNISGQPLNSFLFDVRGKLMEALTIKVEVRQRKPRTPKVKELVPQPDTNLSA